MRDTILVVDDMEFNRVILAEILQYEYRVLQAENGREALALLERQRDEIALILLDLLMPEMDGFEFLNIMNDRGWMEKIPVLIISSENSVNAERRCFELGISDFIRKPFDNVLVKKRVKNIVDLFLYKNALEEKVERQTETLKEQNQLLKIQADKLKKSNIKIIDILGTVVEYRNLESGEHIKRVRGFTEILARQLMIIYPEYGLTQEKVEMIASASALHDVGKIAIPDNILLKPGKLTQEEFECMKTHTIKGCEILNNITGAWDEDYGKISYEICRYHHERYDGRGYPDALSGEEIPISAQIVSLADVYDALVSPRVYKSAYSGEQTFQMIMDGQCGVFSPKLLRCFQAVRGEFEVLAAG